MVAAGAAVGTILAGARVVIAILRRLARRGALIGAVVAIVNGLLEDRVVFLQRADRA